MLVPSVLASLLESVSFGRFFGAVNEVRLATGKDIGKYSFSIFDFFSVISAFGASEFSSSTPCRNEPSQ